jgi:tetratricopeptide (TPR) repeat protein
MPNSALAHDALSSLLAHQGRYDKAIVHARAALELAPHLAYPRATLGCTLVEVEAYDDAAAELRRAIEIDPSQARAHHVLAGILTRQGDHAAAINHFRQAVQYEPNKARYHVELANALIGQERYGETIHVLDRAMRYTESERISNTLAWLLATHPDESLRDCDRAVTLITRLINNLDKTRPVHLDTLGAAYACAGRFDEAARTARQAAALARQAGREPLAESIDARADLYRNHQPCRNPKRQAE